MKITHTCAHLFHIFFRLDDWLIRLRTKANLFPSGLQARLAEFVCFLNLSPHSKHSLLLVWCKAISARLRRSSQGVLANQVRATN